MKQEIVSLTKDISHYSLYSADLAPVPKEKRTWTTLSLAALWVGMAVCIPTYLLASYMIKSGMGWLESLIIIGVANLIITIPMILNAHAGVKYGIPFPVLGRASFGTRGIHLPSITRAFVACGWFGIQTWVGGLALYEIIHAFNPVPIQNGLDVTKFLCFMAFWFLNMYFVWKGNKSIKWLEEFSAPILILLGIALIVWGSYNAGGFKNVLSKCEQLQHPTASIQTTGNSWEIQLNPLVNANSKQKAEKFQLKSISYEKELETNWENIPKNGKFEISNENQLKSIKLRFKNEKNTSSWVNPVLLETQKNKSSTWFDYVKWLTVMLGFWATMSLSISDISRFAPSQKSQKIGQFLGLPGTMLLFSFIAIFVTCAAALIFNDVLISEDAPWDPVALLGKFESPWVVIITQLFMIIATLSTNIAANVIAPSNAFSNLFPRKVSFKMGGTITGIIGILICPWWLMNDISNLMIFISGLLGPVLGIMLCDYFIIRKKELILEELYNPSGVYSYGKYGYNFSALIALLVGVIVALVWSLIPSLSHFADFSWFTGFFVSFIMYYFLMPKSILKKYGQIPI
jgi:cytosine/uracil/thiamine/allantoin permease